MVNFTRWRKQTNGELVADILAARIEIVVSTAGALVIVDGKEMMPDEARLYGVRLIEAAALAAGDSTVREPHEPRDR